MLTGHGCKESCMYMSIASTYRQKEQQVYIWLSTLTCLKELGNI